MATLQLTASTLAVTPAAGQLEFDGHFYATDSGNIRAKINRLVQSTAQATTSGTSIDFTSIPNWVKRITIIFNSVSTSSTSQKLIQIGSGTILTTGYVGSASTINSGAATTSHTTGFGIRADGAAFTISGLMTICNVSGNIWVASQTTSHSATESGFGGGVVTLASVLDRVRITTVNGTDTFDGGSVNIMYEG